ncbi:hypothetical protein A2870_00535 [Candidatus Curtissbacteria bacterium RIFCSPHIGHO2_01_FULL_41_11]|uniref:Uncharacterized protein n=1 Tax=Candidatus Curtissbacteria bacterium RIFCSPHIGHO2_01_FULL_41_11 TaxID=1797711 RepID=A0A1F5G876_9BACT|nr:MAG: hypothetical protein A2870_00535 [Candidatus Curtissbacteria bacterium RIFCSPHIGHO2_01_FULL_41_11]
MVDKDDKGASYKKELYTENARRARFERVAERRINKILEYLRLLGNTSNRTLYLYNDSDVNRIFNAIDERLLQIKGKFKKSKYEEKFRL